MMWFSVSVGNEPRLCLCAGYRRLPGPAGRGRALADGAPRQAAALPGDPGLSCQHPGPLPRSHQGVSRSPVILLLMPRSGEQLTARLTTPDDVVKCC